MSVGVIDVLKMIDVGEDNREGRATPVLARAFTAYAIHDYASIADSSQIVVGGSEQKFVTGSDELVLQVEEKICYVDNSSGRCEFEDAIIWRDAKLEDVTDGVVHANAR